MANGKQTGILGNAEQGAVGTKGRRVQTFPACIDHGRSAEIVEASVTKAILFVLTFNMVDFTNFSKIDFEWFTCGPSRAESLQIYLRNRFDELKRQTTVVAPMIEETKHVPQQPMALRRNPESTVYIRECVFHHMANGKQTGILGNAEQGAVGTKGRRVQTFPAGIDHG